MIAILLLSPLIHLLIAVLVGLLICICVEVFIKDGRILMIVRLIIGLIVLAYALQLFGIAI